MKKKEKKMILILVIITIVITGVLLFLTNKNKKNADEIKTNPNEEEFVQILEDGTKLNISTKMKEPKELEGLLIENIQLTNKEEKTELIADVKNNTQKDTEAILVNIIFYNKEGDEIATIGGRISPLKVGQTMQFSTTAMMDYSNAYNFKIERK